MTSQVQHTSPRQVQAIQLTIADQAVAQVLKVATSDLAADPETVVLIAGLVAAANLSASLTVDHGLFTRPDPRPFGEGGPGRPLTDEPRLAKVSTLILHDHAALKTDPLPSLTRLAHSEPMGAARMAAKRGMEARGIPSYTWLLDADPCPICAARTGPVPVAVHPFSHPHCGCLPIPQPA